MRTRWPEPVERVADFLRRTGAEARLEELEPRSPTAGAVAEAAGCSLDRLVESIVFACRGGWFIALVPGDRRPDLAKLATAADGTTARIASREEVLTLTGLEPAAVAPFPRPRLVEGVFVDRTLLTHDLLWLAAGSTAHFLAIRPAELLRLSRGQPLDAVQEAAYHSGPRGDD
ncbi:MAG: hypothetical protein MSC30_16120 [Gaiellaceae bacterium MAG52_C11]|nr:hypothetical protein [Candidatus Gaiellasilicea maunaloa]